VIAVGLGNRVFIIEPCREWVSEYASVYEPSTQAVIPHEHHSPGVTIYPQPPMKSNLKFQSDYGSVNYWILDQMGRILLNGEIRDTRTESIIELGRLVPGLYYLQVYNESFHGDCVQFFKR
jgi:hypothetical protein